MKYKSFPNNTRNYILRLSLAAYFGAAGSLLAAPFAYTDGDLLLGFQALGGTGQTINVFFNLGSGISHRDNGNLGFRGNIGNTLSAAYGTNWYERTDLFFGVFANLNPNPNTGIGSAGAVNGDPSRTVYVSRTAAAPGLATLWTGLTSNSLGVAGGDMNGTEQTVVQLTANADNSANLVQTTDPALWANGWTARNPAGPPVVGFTSFSGGIQQNFGKGGSATYVDVQRILSTNTGANPTAPVLGRGTYETTIAISSTGAITASTSAASTGFSTWIAGNFAGGTLPVADRDPLDDPEGDGIENALEFVLNGDPTVNSQSILPTLDASGTNFVFSFTRRDDSVTEVPAIFQYGSDLSGWTNVPVAASGTVDGVIVAVTPGDAITDGVVVTLPKSKAVGGKLFGRLQVVK